MIPIQGAEPREPLLECLQNALGGRVYANVSVCGTAAGRWPSGTADHRVDAVVLPAHDMPGIVAWAETSEEFPEAFSAAPTAYVAVARNCINRPLLGLLVAATAMLSRSYPRHGLLLQAAAIEEGGAEENIAWVYRKRGIRIIPCD